MDTKKYLCNNCGNYGHLFYNCKKPITSLGIITYRYNPSGTIEYLLVQRKDTLGYVDFLRGKFSDTNLFQLKNIIDEMTLEEIERIQTYEYKELWYKLWNKVTESYDSKNEEKFNLIKKTKKDLFLPSRWSEPEWGFPKGRRNFKERDLECALREFEEETGYEKKDLHFIKNLNPMEEIFTGSNLKSYKHRYFLAYMKYEDTLIDTNYQKSEIGSMKWFTYTEVLEKIRPYNIERLDLVQDIHHLIEKCIIF
jgi:8-oxo-dGTP pyrophosphatase MutT (NUDIX family)